ncbi:SGNH/GDSL hydrolase family protein [uncultured Cyclobacterium sp.]|uniref:SGNH/GDSL hydrolase family protein n=1 Tax=uncultured Cyclobacterium sp. TaxID=453820 RepID=UPI0030EBF030|tara:strand:- start:36549 stop:37355 length:807 start_codon:yes stop_codon:yes gene_type:complete
MNKLSRRRFVEKSIFLLPLPAILSFTNKLSSLEASPVFLPSGESDKERIAALLKDKAPLIWTFTGDSITHGAKHTHGYRSYPEVFGERIRWELGRVRDVIINTGISGNTTETILQDFDWRVKQFNPKVVSLMIGTNDCSNEKVSIETYEENLHLLVKKIRALGAIPILHTPNLIIKALDMSRASLVNYVEVIKKVAFEENIILVDNYGHWLETAEKDDGLNVNKEWLNDPLHPGGEGHSEIARLMFKELSIFDPEASTCGGPYYEGKH